MPGLKVSDGRIGVLNKVVVEYEQGWLCEETQLSSTGAISSLADVGTHALQLAQYVTGAVVTSVFADVSTMVGGARTPDDANILFKLSGGGRGVMIASQASAGQANGLRLRCAETVCCCNRSCPDSVWLPRQCAETGC